MWTNSGQTSHRLQPCLTDSPSVQPVQKLNNGWMNDVERVPHGGKEHVITM